MDALREAMYELIETRDVSEIKVVDLIRKAGVSRGGFYKNDDLVTDVLKDDIKEVSGDVKQGNSYSFPHNHSHSPQRRQS